MLPQLTAAELAIGQLLKWYRHGTHIRAVIFCCKEGVSRESTAGYNNCTAVLAGSGVFLLALVLAREGDQ